MAGQRTIHTIPVVKVLPLSNDLPEPPPKQLETPAVSPEDILQQARDEAAFILEQARAEADCLVDEAKRQAETILAEAANRVEEAAGEAREEGYQSGYQAGFQAGKADGEADYRQLIGETVEMINGFEEEKKALMRDSHLQIVQLACAIAEKIMEKELEVGGSWIENTVKSALAELVDRSQIEIVAHPEDIPLLLKFREECSTIYDSQMEIRYSADEKIRKGGCILRTRQGTVDARIECQLNEVKRALLESANAFCRE
jgi:flagellar assembly protein FliH